MSLDPLALFSPFRRTDYLWSRTTITPGKGDGFLTYNCTARYRKDPRIVLSFSTERFSMASSPTGWFFGWHIATQDWLAPPVSVLGMFMHHSNDPGLDLERALTLGPLLRDHLLQVQHHLVDRGGPSGVYSWSVAHHQISGPSGFFQLPPALHMPPSLLHAALARTYRSPDQPRAGIPKVLIQSGFWTIPMDLSIPNTAHARVAYARARSLDPTSLLAPAA